MKIKAKKSLGQNFLHDTKILNKIIESGEIKENEHIIEIGPGLGALTSLLIDQKCLLTAIELDDRLIPLLKEKFSNKSNFELIHMNALDYIPKFHSYKVIANIPYYITSPLINHFLSKQVLNKGQLPEIIVMLIQKEVAEKICDQKSSVISLMVKLFGDPELVCIAKGSAFKPAPKVDSAVIKIKNIKDPNLNNLEDFFIMLKACFLNPRKTLKNNLKHFLTLKNLDFSEPELAKIAIKSGIDQNLRPEQLDLKQWLNLFQIITH